MLLNGRVVAGGIQIQAAGKGHRAKRAVGSKGHIVGFGHGGDLLALGQAAGMGKVRLHDVHAANGQQTFEIVLGEQAFTGSNGDVAGCCDFGEVLHVIAENGFLNEHGVELLQLFGDQFCHGFVHPSVEVDGDAEVPAAAFSHAGNTLQQRIHLGVAVQKLQLVGAVHFDGGEALLFLFQCSAAHIGGAVAAHPAVHPHLIAAAAAHQLPDRHIEVFALDIPQGLIDAGDGAHQDAAAAVEAAAEQHSPQVFDLHGVGTNEVRLHLMDALAYGGGAAFQHRLAPAGNACIGADLNKSPAGTHQPCLNFCDLHSNAPLRTKNTVRFQPCFSVRDRTVSKIIANYGVCRLPSRLRVWVQVVTVFSQGYFAASFSFRSTPRPGLSLA